VCVQEIIGKQFFTLTKTIMETNVHLLRAVSIDDDEAPRAMIKNYVQRFFAAQIDFVGEADSVDSGVTLIQHVQPHLVFLDIDLGLGTGFDVLDECAANGLGAFHVIFVTSFQEFAVRAIRYDATDFLVKPLIGKDFRTGVERVLAKLSQKQASEPSVSMVEQDRLMLAHRGSITIVYLKDLMYCSAEGSYTNFILIDGSQEIASKVLGEYEEFLEPRGFVRISRSMMVNMRHIRRLEWADSRTGMTVQMSDVKTRLPVSRSYQHIVKERFMTLFK